MKACIVFNIQVCVSTNQEVFLEIGLTVRTLM